MQTVNEKDSKNAGADGQAPFQATQVQTTMKLYERIQGYIFRLMATDSVPRVSPSLHPSHPVRDDVRIAKGRC